MSLTLDEMLAIAPYSLAREEKRAMQLARLKALTAHHYAHCAPYRQMLDAQGIAPQAINAPEAIPFLPVSLFKTLTLKSVADEEVVKTMTSSGTTGQQVSRIFLDKTTAAMQQKTLVKIVSHFTGAGRMPMLIIDSPEALKDRLHFSARGAGILGFSLFGADRAWALDEEMNLNIAAIEAFLEKHRGKRILMFGFTFMVWQHFYKALATSGKRLALDNALLIHGGGWKKLANQAVSKAEYKARLRRTCGITKVHDYYGMAEQAGSIFMECECGHLHASDYSGILFRRAADFSLCDVGEWGIIQVLSTLPKSYPGHSILTEDEGRMLGVDDCPCGRKGAYFEVAGRLKHAQIRGCSDTFRE